MICSMRAVQPYSPVTRQQGDDSRRLETTTLSTLVSSTSLMSLHRPSVLAFSSSESLSLSPSLVEQSSFLPSNSFSCCTAYSSI